MDIFNAAINLIQTIRFLVGGSGRLRRTMQRISAHALLCEIAALDISGGDSRQGRKVVDE